MQILLDLDPALLRELDEVAPGRKRQRSQFIRDAIRKALDEAAERRTADGYRRFPDSSEPSYFDPDEWEPAARPARGRKR